LPDLNKKLLDGRFIIRCFKSSGDKNNTWWIWKATDDPYPINPYCHVDQGFQFLIPASSVKHFGHESYKEWEEREESC